ncbi:PREDICTED: uncharacterized protein LOC106748376 [Dinoponera quadriceps]|uniref:Uncharacterized protein LOC106748376 n=1 Tax=Dinoponera quadriceps TaxID=609295 RepID=A0A6P3XUY6_DINQU|nr:PREDICTED: uncharacterized protein LOC106748376 [Dinoponera quadriceps]
MYTIGAEVKTKRANYYLPIEQASQCKKIKCESVSTEKPRIPARILGRRYMLTTTSYKFLEIGISVGPASYVELVLGDNRGNHLILPHEIWKEIIHRRAHIERYVVSPNSSPLWIRDLSVECRMMHGDTIIKLTLFNKSLYLKPETLNNLFNFVQCIDHMYSWLYENTHIVNAKFQKFVCILQQNDIIRKWYESKTTDWSYAAKVIRESDDFDSESLVDCELLACALKHLVHYVLNN